MYLSGEWMTAFWVLISNHKIRDRKTKSGLSLGWFWLLDEKELRAHINNLHHHKMRFRLEAQRHSSQRSYETLESNFCCSQLWWGILCMSRCAKLTATKAILRICNMWEDLPSDKDNNCNTRELAKIYLNIHLSQSMILSTGIKRGFKSTMPLRILCNESWKL